jgi:hypothetical protein
MGMIVEGRTNGSTRGRSSKRPDTSEYTRLNDPGNVEEALGLDKNTTQKNFIY